MDYYIKQVIISHHNIKYHIIIKINSSGHIFNMQYWIKIWPGQIVSSFGTNLGIINT